MDNQRATRAEAALLGCLIASNDTWDGVADLITDADFVSCAHRSIFAAIAAQAQRYDPFDIITLAERMERAGTLAEIGGLPALAILAEYVNVPGHAPHYARIVREQSILRQTVSVCEAHARDARDGEQEAHVILETAQRRLGEIAEQAQRDGGTRSMSQLLSDAIQYLDAACQRGGDLVGLATGYADLDKITSGLQAQDLIILAARPSMGKTSMALCIAENIAMTRDANAKPVAFFSLEMSARSLTLRSIASQARVDFGRLRNGDLADDEWGRVTNATQRLNAARLHIDDAPALTVSDIAARCRKLARTHGGLSLVVVDYLQLIASRGKSENRNIEVMKISQDLKALAKSLQVPVIALSQLNRGLEQRTNKRPIMADLRDSGSIEQDADLVLFLYRDEVYHEQTPEKGVAELIVAKQRNGATGTLRLAFNGHCCRFDDLARDWQPPPRPDASPARAPRKASYEY